MPSLKAIRKRIVSVKSTQKITRAMKMVAGARLNRAQQRITELRPYAVKLQDVLGEITAQPLQAVSPEGAGPPDASAGPTPEGFEVIGEKPPHPLLVTRPEQRVLLVVLTS